MPPTDPPLTLVPASLQVFPDDYPLEEFFQHSVIDFLHLLR